MAGLLSLDPPVHTYYGRVSVLSNDSHAASGQYICELCESWVVRAVESYSPTTYIIGSAYKSRSDLEHLRAVMLVLVFVLVLKDSLRTKMQSLSWSLSLMMQSLSLSLLFKSLSLSWSLNKSCLLYTSPSPRD